MKDFLLAAVMLAAGGAGWFLCCRLDAWLLRGRQDREQKRERCRRS